MRIHAPVTSSLQILDETSLDAVVGGGMEDDGDEYFDVGFEEPSEGNYGNDMVCPSDTAPGGQEWRYIGST